jgi:hypothetical protein
LKQKLYIFDAAYADWRRAAVVGWGWLGGLVIRALAWQRFQRARWRTLNLTVFRRFKVGVGASFEWISDRLDDWKYEANEKWQEFLVYVVVALMFGVVAAAWGIAYAVTGMASGVVFLAMHSAVVGAALLMACATPPMALILAAALVLLAAFSATAYAVAITLRGAEWAPLLVRGIGLTCPGCANRWQWPRYFCAKCGQAHDDLWPGVHGLRYHRCDGAQCGALLPALLLLGRNDLRQECRRCRSFIRADLVAREFHLAVVGARGSGKSNLIAAGVRQMLREVLQFEGFTSHVADPTQLARFNQWRSAHSQGLPLDKTHEHRPPAFTLLCKHADGRRFCLYVYDASGEVFENQQLLAHDASTRHHAFIHGLVLVLDPFAEPCNQGRFALTPEEQRSLGPADRPVRDVLERLVEFLEILHGVRPGAPIRVPLAVVVTKADARAVLADCGGGVDVSASGGLASAADAGAAGSARVRAALASWGLGDTIELAERRFPETAYFVCSSLGRSVGAPAAQAAFKPLRSAAPFAWLLHAAGCRTGAPAPLSHRAVQGLRRFDQALRGREGALPRAAALLLCGALATAAGMILLHRRSPHPGGPRPPPVKSTHP